MNNDELNKECAEAMGWDKTSDDLYIYPKHGYDYSPSEMHFHDSYDWAMLLVKKIISLDKPEFEEFSYKFDEPLWNFVNSTPQQISQACLEVLK